MARITIIETGHVPQKYRERHGSFPDMFARMVRAADPSATFDVVSIPDGAALPDPGEVDAILITGAAAGVYDGLDWIAPLEDFVRAAHARATPMVGVCFGHQLIAQALGGVVRKSDKGWGIGRHVYDSFEWILPLEDFVRRAYAGRVPMVGVCFGHQLMAQALGGTVRKSEKGWGIGRHVYDIAPGNGVIDGEHIAIAASHQDQVIAPPPGARTIMSSAFTEHAGLLYGNGTALSVQPHPEFDTGFAHLCCDIRKGHAPAELIAQAKATLAEPVDNARLGSAITRFLTRGRT